MKKVTTVTLTLALFAALLAAAIGIAAPKPVSADAAVYAKETITIVTEKETASPNALARFSLYVEWLNGYVFAVCVNERSLTSNPIPVRIELRGSETLYSQPDTMPVLATGLASNLQQGDEVVAGIKADVTRYYISVIYVNENGKETKYTSGVVHINTDGVVLGS